MVAHLSRYILGVPIADSRPIALDEQNVRLKWKDYRVEGRDQYKQMALPTDEFTHQGPVDTIVFSPDGHTLAIAAGEGRSARRSSSKRHLGAYRLMWAENFPLAGGASECGREEAFLQPYPTSC
jgi:hypothetical protein